MTFPATAAAVEAVGVAASFFLSPLSATVSVSAADLLVRAFLFARVNGVSTKRSWGGSSTRPISISSLDQFQSQSLPCPLAAAAAAPDEGLSSAAGASSSETSLSSLRSEVDQPLRGLALAVTVTIPGSTVWRGVVGGQEVKLRAPLGCRVTVALALFSHGQYAREYSLSDPLAVE